MSGEFQCESGRPCVAGRSQARALTCTTSSGGKNPGATRARVFLQARQSIFKEPLAPQADDLAAGIEASGDSIVGPACGGEEDHLGPDHLKIWQRILGGAAAQFLLLGGRERD
jgi:hypothetical protein